MSSVSVFGVSRADLNERTIVVTIRYGMMRMLPGSDWSCRRETGVMKGSLPTKVKHCR